MVLLLFFVNNQIQWRIISRLFFIHLSLHALALHLAVKILLQIFLYEDLSTLALHTSVGCNFPPECQQDRTCYATNTIKWKNIPNIWHKSSTKQGGQTRLKRAKHNANYAPFVNTWKVLPMAQVAIFKEILWSSALKDLDWELFCLESKRRNVSHYIYYLARYITSC